MSTTPARSARELFDHEVATRTYDMSLKASDPLPDPEDTWEMLHPWEIAVFSIDPKLHMALVCAYEWYEGAICGMVDNEYALFREEERARWPQFVHAGDHPTYDPHACAHFMNQAAGLPLRQCMAYVMKRDACTLRNGIDQFWDGS